MEQLVYTRDPAALPGWLATTTQRECSRTRRSRCRVAAGGQVPDTENLPDEQAATAEDVLFMAERHAALRAAFTDLPANWQQLLTLLTTEPPTPYAEISVKLGIPVEASALTGAAAWTGCGATRQSPA